MKRQSLQRGVAVAASLVCMGLLPGCGGPAPESADASATASRPMERAKPEAHASGGTTIQVDDALPRYRRAPGVSGNLNAVGSDTLNNLMTLWAEEFHRYYPNVRTQIEGKGSSTAPPALIQGVAQLGPMSRRMKSSESDAFEEKYGFPPTFVRVALDALAVYVNKDNPIEYMTIPQVDAVFSKTRRCGLRSPMDDWGQLGLKGAWASKPIDLYGRNSVSGTYGYFKEHALCKGDYRDTVKEQPGSASVVQGVTEDLYGIGYSGIGYRTSGVRAIPLAPAGGGPKEPTMDNVVSQEYPLARYLYIYIVKDPNRPLDPMIREFLTYVLSYEGQQNVVKDGYLPLAEETVTQELGKIHS